MNLKKETLSEWLPHLVGLFFIIILPMFVFDQSDTRIKYWRYRYYYQLSFMLVAFYGNYLCIVPRYFFLKNKLRFSAVLIVFTVLLLSVSQVFSRQFDFNKPPVVEQSEQRLTAERTRNTSFLFGLHPSLFDDALRLMLVFGFSTGMRVLRRMQQEKNQQKEMEKAHVENELAFLKNQINPHFFFNSLNNIYALIAVDGNEAQKSVEKLSGLMRYLIYESDVKQVKLQKEFDFICNYIDLMKQRLTSKIQLKIDIQQDVPDIDVPPLMFITFIENAFKHGVSYRETSFIHIDLHLNDDEIVFVCQNSIPQSQNRGENATGGMGIANIKKRLELLYGNTYQLLIDDKNHTFTVELEIPIGQIS